jgi:hypothetical protein
MGSPSQALDFDTDMQTIRDYVDSIVETQTKLATSYTTALDNFQTTVLTASPTDAKPDLLGAVLKSGLKSIEKVAVTAVKSATGADLGPLVDMLQAVSDEIDRAAKAAQSYQVGAWIKSVRSSVSDAYTQGKTRQGLLDQFTNEYNQNDEGGRGGYIAGIQNELSAMKTVTVPKSETIEVALYAGWINQNSNDDCIDGTGIINLNFDSDGNPDSAKVVAPLGDKIAGALNTAMNGSGIATLMDLEVVKKVCKEDACACFEGDNTVRKSVLDDDTQAFLSSSDTWSQFKRFPI